MSSDELTSALNAYLSHYPNASDELKDGIRDALIENIKQSIPRRAFETFSNGPDDKKANDKIRFVQEYLKSIDHTPTRVETYANAGTSMIHFEAPAEKTQPNSGKVNAEKTFADAIQETVDRVTEAATVRLYGVGANPGLLHSDLTAAQKLADLSSSEVFYTDIPAQHAQFVPGPRIADGTREGANDPDRPDRWELSFSQAISKGIAEGIQLARLREPVTPSAPTPVPYGRGSSVSSSASRPQSRVERAAERAAESITIVTQAGAAVPVAPAWSTSGNITPNSSFRQVEPAPPPERIPPQQPPDPPEDTINAQASRRAAEVRDVLESIPGYAGGGGAQLPPTPPGGLPPEPPDDDDNDEQRDSIMAQLLAMIQRFMGVVPSDGQTGLNSVLRNLSGVFGATPEQQNTDNPLAGFMTAFADYFGVRDVDNTDAEENLDDAIERLIGAVNENTNAQTQRLTLRQRIGQSVANGARRAGRGLLRASARVMRPVARLAARVVPARVRQAAQRMGAQIVGGQAARLGVPAAVAARFGAALGPAALAVGGVMLLASIATSAAKALKGMADQAWTATQKLVDYSGQLAFANAGLQVSREMRKFNAANAVVEGGIFNGADRIDAENRLERANAPLENLINIIGNDIGTAWTNMMAWFAETRNSMFALGLDILAALHDAVPDVLDKNVEEKIRKRAEDLRNPPGQQDMLQMLKNVHDRQFGNNAVDVVDMQKRLGGPRPRVGGGNP